jgi:diguanylate cyclase with GGDEF domain
VLSFTPNPSRLVPRTAAHVVGGIGALAIIGWVLKLPELTTFFTTFTSMKVNTALSFMLLAAALLVAIKKEHPRVQAFLAGAAVVISCLTLFEYITGWQLGIDQILLADPVAATYPGRMSPISAFNFVLLGVAFMPFRGRTEILRETLALAAAVISMFAIVGYLYGIPPLYGVIRATWMPIAIHTGASFMLLAVGFLFIPRDHGLVRIFQGPSIAAMVARFLIPVAIVIPVLLGAIFMDNQLSRGHLPLAMALSVVSNVVLLVGLIWYFSFMIERTERERAALRHEADTDRLTGIYNRGYFENSLEYEVERARRYESPLSLIIFDIDWFKKLNDRYGHLIGDLVLVRIVREARRNLRSTDVFCRYGGEEFSIIAPETTADAPSRWRSVSGKRSRLFR